MTPYANRQAGGASRFQAFRLRRAAGRRNSRSVRLGKAGGAGLLLAGVLAGLCFGAALRAQNVPTAPPPQFDEPRQFVFVTIPAGEFQMGCSPDDGECAAREKPRHRVRISESFEMNRYLITQAMWEAVMQENPSHFRGPDRPVERVTWDEAQEFLKRMNRRHDGYQYRLATEAEWEYAARAGTTGKRYGDLDAIAWYNVNSGGETHPVGQKQPNAWGLYDMLGNVWEWLQDRYELDYYQHSPLTDPQGPSRLGKPHVLRGGSWYGAAWDARVSNRAQLVSEFRDEMTGLRCVRVPASRER
jgi:formylglycine-generating enzyme required for sulfatase activity